MCDRCLASTCDMALAAFGIDGRGGQWIWEPSARTRVCLASARPRNGWPWPSQRSATKRTVCDWCRVCAKSADAPMVVATMAEGVYRRL